MTSGGQNVGSEILYPFTGVTLPLSLQRVFRRQQSKMLSNKICDFTSTGIPPLVEANSQSQDNRPTLSLTQGAQQVGVPIGDGRRAVPVVFVVAGVTRFEGRVSSRIIIGHGVLPSFCRILNMASTNGPWRPLQVIGASGTGAFREGPRPDRCAMLRPNTVC